MAPVTTNERACELWSTWVGQQTPATFAVAVRGYSPDIRAAVVAYVREARDSLDDGATPQSTDAECAEAVEAILLRISQEEDRTDPRD